MNEHNRRACSPRCKQRLMRRQRGAALMLAMVIMVLVVTLAAGMTWQHARAIQVESAERGRAQLTWLLSGARDWSELILREDLRDDRRNAKLVDHLGEPWATPLEEARLSTFLAADRSGTTRGDEDGPDAFLSGSITDAQAKWNLLNLIAAATASPPTGAPGGSTPATRGTAPTPAPSGGSSSTPPTGPDPNAVAVLDRLCAAAGLPNGSADAIAATFDAAMKGGPTSPVQPRTLRELTLLGVDARVIEALEPFVIVLPVSGTRVNLNTASRDVLAAVFDLSGSQAQTVIDYRQRDPLKTVPKQAAWLVLTAAQQALVDNNGAVSTSYFEVRGRLRLDQHIVEELSLIHRRSTNDAATVHRERINSVESLRR
jgi:general secretion pathway protein K